MIPLEEERGLVRRTKAGSQRSFETLEQDCRVKVFLHVRKLLKDELETEEIYQRGLIRAWKKIKSFRGECRFSTWLSKICYNLAYDDFRNKKNKRTDSFEALVDAGSLREADVAFPFRSSEKSGYEKLRLKESGAQLARVLSRLQPKYKEVLRMFVAKQMSYSEIAKKLKISKGTVMSRLFYARKKARKLYRQTLTKE